MPTASHKKAQRLSCSASYRKLHLLYKLCSVQLNCTYSNYTEVAAKYQLHNSTAHLLYKYCTNCTVCNWTVLTVITQKLPLYVQLHNSTQTLQLMSSDVQCSRLISIIHISVHSVISLDRTFQIHATATQHSATCSQLHETLTTAPLFRAVCVYKQSHEELRFLNLTLMSASAMSHFGIGKEQVDVTKIADTLCKMKININIFIK